MVSENISLLEIITTKSEIFFFPWKQCSFFMWWKIIKPRIISYIRDKLSWPLLPALLYHIYQRNSLDFFMIFFNSGHCSVIHEMIHHGWHRPATDISPIIFLVPQAVRVIVKLCGGVYWQGKPYICFGWEIQTCVIFYFPGLWRLYPLG